MTTTEAPPVTDRMPAQGLRPERRRRLGSFTEDSRALWSVAGLTLVMWAIRLSAYVDLYPAVTVAVVVVAAWGLATAAGVWGRWRLPPVLAGSLAWATLALNAVAIALWSGVQVALAPQYGTDELAFDQYAGQLLEHGINPYVHSMAQAFQLFNVSPDGYTFLLNGHTVVSLSYPALSFLVYVPFLLAGWSTQLAVSVNVAAWLLSLALLFVLLPKRLRPLAIVVGSLGIYVSYAVGGVTDALFVPLLVGAVYRWDRFGVDTGWRMWRGPALLGLAMAVKQTPWLVLPFLLTGVVLERSRREGLASGLHVGGQYLAIALGAFALPNLPFIIWAPHAWLSDVVTPIVSQTVPAGQGLVDLSLFFGVGGGSLVAYSVVLAVVFTAIWVVFAVTYPSLKGWTVFLPSIILFFSARSLGSYLVTLFPAALVAACSVGSTAPDERCSVVERPRERARGPSRLARSGRLRSWWGHIRRRRARYAVGVGVGASLAAIAAALLSPAPLVMTIASVRTTGQLATVVQVDVEVTNTTGQGMTPAFTVANGGAVTAFWTRASGPARLGPHQSARYTLLAPNFFAQPAVSSGFQVVAFTDNAVSRTSAYLPSAWHVTVSPDAISQDVPVGVPVTVHAQILNRFGQPVRLPGQPIYLGQIIYGQNGLQYSEAIVNHGNIGQTPVAARTNSRGEATFTIRGTVASTSPVYFEANLVNARQGYPYGYSQILPIRFGPHR